MLTRWQAAVAVWWSMSWGARTAVLIGVGLLVAYGINRAIDRWSFERRGIDPWLPAPEGLPSRSGLDRLPLLGWWRLRREASHFQSRFWLRAIAIELAFPLAVAALYHWEVSGRLTLADGPRQSIETLHAQFVLHAALLALMTIATFIDFDEQTIPDEVTLGGTAIGLVWLALLPVASLPTTVIVGWVPQAAHVVVTTSNHVPTWRSGLGGPESWPGVLDHVRGLLLGLLCLGAWYVAAVPKIWTTRKGLWRAFRFAWGSILKYRTWRFPSLLLAIMSTVTVVAWRHGGPAWEAVFSSLVGMVAVGGGTWAVRLIASRALGVEALGFGDVTLMAMIGTMLGWQAGLLVFFFAPATALIVALLQLLLAGDREIAFGPYLCLAALFIVVCWRRVWFGWAEPIFSMGWILPAVVAVSLAFLGAMLTAWRWIKDSVGGA